MAVRESFLTVSDSLAAAPGPGYYTQEQGFGTDRRKGTLHNKVCLEEHAGDISICAYSYNIACFFNNVQCMTNIYPTIF